MTEYWGLGPWQVTSGLGKPESQGSRTLGQGCSQCHGKLLGDDQPVGHLSSPTSLTSTPGKSGTCLLQPNAPKASGARIQVSRQMSSSPTSHLALSGLSQSTSYPHPCLPTTSFPPH